MMIDWTKLKTELDERAMKQDLLSSGPTWLYPATEGLAARMAVDVYIGRLHTRRINRSILDKVGFEAWSKGIADVADNHAG